MLPVLAKIRIAILFGLTFLCCVGASGAKQSRPSRKVVGVVVDSITGERLPFINVYSKKAKAGTTTDVNGVFTIHVPVGTKLDITSLGYEPQSVTTHSGKDTLRVSMHQASTELMEVVVRPKKQKYSKKNNPAVELMQRVRNDRKKIDPRQSPFYSYDQYDKMIIALNNYNGYKPAENGEVKGKYKVMSDLVDTAIWTGKRILDLSMKEKASTRLITGDGADKTVVRGQRNNGVDKALDENYTRGVFEDFLREVDVYSSDISLMKTRFVSPLSPIASDYYMYHIVDTVLIGKDECVELTFAPHNPESLGFNGKLYIPVNDSVKWVRRVMMRLPKAANVNYIENIYLSQTFDRDSLGYVHKKLDDLVIEMHLVGSFGQAYVSRQSRYANQSYDRRDDLDPFYSKIGSVFMIDEATSQPGEFWEQARMVPLSYAESILAKDESPYRKNPFIYWTTKVVELVVKGYIITSKKSYFDFGPIDTFISTNGTEGVRLALGGLTTANLSKHVFARGYAAYGCKDHKWKYKGELEYSFNPKKYHSREFPMNGIRASYSYDVNKLGQHYMTNCSSNLLNSIKRMESDLTTYEHLAQLAYNIEWRNNLSFQAILTHQRQESSNRVQFVRGDGSSVFAYNQNSLRLQLRYAPGEKFMQTYNERRNINRDAICMVLAHTFGPKGFIGSEYTINLTEFLLQKRFWFSAFGYADVIFKAAKLWNQVQFPALLWQNANIAYTMQSETFSLLNPMEFAMDQYVSLDLNYNLNGLILNRIPGINKLRLREVVSFKGFAGHLSRKNDPAYNENLFRFPDPSVTQAMGKTPYMELGVGLDNILTILRIDYIWRLSYRNKKGAPNSGLRFSLNFSF